MHYESIANVAFKVGLLNSNARNRSISMSTALSNDVANNPLSIFKKTKPGVYSLNLGGRLGYAIAMYRGVGKRITRLMNELKFQSSIYVIRKAFYLLQKAMSYSEEGWMLLDNGIEQSKVCIFSPSFLEKSEPRWKQIYRDSEKHAFSPLEITHEHLATANQVTNAFSLLGIREAFDLSLMLLEIAELISDQGLIILSDIKNVKEEIFNLSIHRFDAL